MKIKAAINGYGRIGRCILRSIYEYKHNNDIEIIAINNPSNHLSTGYLTKYDTTHGLFPFEVQQINDKILQINNDKILILSERDVKKINWDALGVDLIFECTGAFVNMKDSYQHIESGAKKVIISAPAGKLVDATIVYGVNHKILKNKKYKVISNASCTTNCLAPISDVLNKNIGIVSGLITTIHSLTNDQNIIDVSHKKDWRRGRSGISSIIPTKTGAAKGIGLVLPELEGKLDGFAMRVPTINVSLVDLTFQSKKKTCVEEINSLIEEASSSYMKNIIQFNKELIVSSDINHNTYSSIFDSTLTKVIGNTVKVFSWYDNEWGFSNRMIDLSKYFINN